MYLGNKEICCIGKGMLLFCLFYFPQNTVYFIILSSSVEIILRFFINHVLKFKYQPSHLKVKVSRSLLSFVLAYRIDLFVINHCVEVMFQ
jgi:hypothetical protein